jgi:hypothetical protein
VGGAERHRLITAISTAGAFVAAVVAAALSARVYFQGRKRRRSEQANRIAAEEFHRRLDGVVLKYGCAV